MELTRLAEQYDALLVVDDAHGFGVLGQRGNGSLEHFNLVPNSRIIYMGTLGKAAGISGAFIAAHQDIAQWILQTGRAYIYTTASPPMIAHGLLKSLELIQTGDVRRQLFNNIVYFKKNLSLKHWKLLGSETAIQPIVIGDNEKALSAAQQLFDQGIWVPAIRPPTVPKGTARLRITLSATHQPDQIDRLVLALHSAEKALGT
jgi:8-amino-7-oxononanoate synthase